MNIFHLKYKNPITVILFLILAGGVYCISNIQIGLFPDITFPKIKIIADNGEQPVDKMMVTVTTPLENAIKKVEDLKLLRSSTSKGSCEISAFLKWNSDVDLGKQRIEAQINSIKEALPQGINITVEKMNPSIFPIMGFSLESKTKNQIELRQIAEYIVKPFLSRIEGISNIEVIGGKVKEFKVFLDPVKLSNLRLNPQAIMDILGQKNFVASNGYLTDYNRLYLILVDAAVKDKADLENTVISNSAENLVRLKDISNITIDERIDYIKINANGQDAPLISIMKQPNANLIEVSQSIEKEMVTLRKLLPKDVTLRPYYNQSDFVGDSIKSLEDVLLIGLLLALIVTILFLRSLKACSVILITIPLTLGLTITILYSSGYTLNIMTIGSIAAAIGLIIDDAIIVIEQIHRTHEEHPDEPNSILIEKTLKFLFPAMVGSSLSTIVIFIPFFLMSGVAGSYFKVMTDTMIITLTCSFFVTWIGLPVIYLFFSKSKKPINSNEKSKSLKQRVWVSYFIKKPFIAILFVAILIVISIVAIPKLPSGFLPEMDEGSIILDFVSPPGSSLETTDKMLKTVDGILKNTPEVESFSRRIGAQNGFFITEPNTGDYLIQLKKDRNKSTEEISDGIRKEIEAVLPALRVDFGQLIEDMLGDLMHSTQPIEIKIFGEDNNQLMELAKNVAESIESVPGTADVFDGITIAGPEVKLLPKSENLAKYQLNPNDLQSQIQLQTKGTVVSSILGKNQLFDIRVFNGKPQQSANKMMKNYIFLKDGKIIPVNEFVDMNVTQGVPEISRENLKPMIAITARLNNRDLGSVLKDVKSKLQNNVHLPQGYEIVYGGAYAEQQQSFKELLTILILAILLVFTVTLFLFKRVKISIVMIIIAVLGISGSVIALFLTSTPLNVGSYTGIIMIVGIIGENSIFTYLQFQEAKRKGFSKDDSIVYSISTRLRPKLMTAMSAICALIPLAIGSSAGAKMHQPLAISIIGGLIIALPLLLVVLPTMLRYFDE
jgi:heavy metal efflux system protein